MIMDQLRVLSPNSPVETADKENQVQVQSPGGEEHSGDESAIEETGAATMQGPGMEDVQEKELDKDKEIYEDKETGADKTIDQDKVITEVVQEAKEVKDEATAATNEMRAAAEGEPVSTNELENSQPKTAEAKNTEHTAASGRAQGIEELIWEAVEQDNYAKAYWLAQAGVLQKEPDLPPSWLIAAMFYACCANRDEGAALKLYSLVYDHPQPLEELTSAPFNFAIEETCLAIAASASLPALIVPESATNSWLRNGKLAGEPLDAILNFDRQLFSPGQIPARGQAGTSG